MIGRMVVTNVSQFRRELEQADKTRRRAAMIAIRVEAFRLKKVMQEELKAGRPGGVRLENLRFVTTGRRNRERKPLARLAVAVRYWQHKQYAGRVNKNTYSVGFNGGAVVDIHGYAKKNNQIGSSWLRIARMQQEGYTTDPDAPTRIGSSIRRLWRRIGKDMPAKSWLQKFYFLRRSTTSLITPARPIIEPFWRKHRDEAYRNILRNFNRKMRGERI